MTGGGEDPALDRVYLEVRFPRRMAFIDHVGHLADGFGEAFEEVQILNSGVRLFDMQDEKELTLTPEQILVSNGHGDARWAVETLTAAVSQFGKTVGLESVDCVGARQFFLHPVGGVSDATALFRSLFFDYRVGSVTAFGEEPIEARATVAYEVEGGGCRLEATAISRQSPEQTTSEEEPPGALLLDVDRTNRMGTDLWAVREMAESLLTDGHARAVDFVSRLKMAEAEPDTRGE